MQYNNKLADGSVSQRRYFLKGVFDAFSVGMVVLALTFFGFGVLAKSIGLDWEQSVFVTLTMFALPGQVVLADELSRGAGYLAAAFTVTISAVRLLPMTVSLLLELRDERYPYWVYFILSHFIAVTVWIEMTNRLPAIDRCGRVAFYFGFCCTLISVCMLSTAIGNQIARDMPPLLAASLLFITPVYFCVSMLKSMKDLEEYMALVLGMIFGSVFYLIVPGFDLVLAGLLGGSIAYGWGRFKGGDYGSVDC